jgi:hypothetical protein
MVGTEHPLTKADVKALKTCDTICFRFIEEGAEGFRAEKTYSQLECLKRASESEPWEQKHEIPTLTAFEIYGDSPYRKKVTSAFESVDNYSYALSPIKTVVGLLKEGDILTIQWGADAGSNQYCKEKYLHSDQLHLVVSRGNKKMMFFLRQSVCENNSARMVRLRDRKEGEIK